MKPAIRWKLVPPIFIAVIALGAAAAVLIPRGGATTPALAGTVLNSGPAPDFHLRDQFGKMVSLRQLRGRPVILTFMEAHCTELCPVVTATIRRSVAEMGAAGKRVAIVALSVDPKGDTPAAVRSFSRKFGLYHRWLYLTGSRRTLTPVWRAYYLYVAPANAPARIRDSHTSATYLIDPQGRERVLIGGDPATADLQRDLLILAGLPVKPTGAFAVPAPQDGHPAPEFTLSSLNGPSLSLRSLRGKTVVLNFFATWCEPCRTESPLLARWYQRMRRQGAVVLGVDEQDGRGSIAAFARRYGLNYPIVLDGNGDLAPTYDIAYLPKTLVIDPHGTIAAVHAGQIDSTYLAGHVTPLVTAARG